MKKIRLSDEAQRKWDRHEKASNYVLDNFELGDPTSSSFARADDPNNVIIWNDSGADRSFGEILEITDLKLTNLDDRSIWLIGGAVTLANAFGILVADVKDDEPGEMAIVGPCIAQVNIADADHRYAIPAASNHVLQSSGIGPVKILWKPTGTGQKTCAVNLLGVTGEILIKNASGGDYAANGGPHDYQVWAGITKADTGQVISLYNIPAFKNGKFGAASYLDGIGYACPWEQ